MIPSNFKFAVNSHGCNKDWDFKLLSSRFEDIEGTIDDVMNHIQQGHAICAGLLRGRWRKKANFAGSQWILAEIDNADIQHDAEGKIIRDENGKATKIYAPQLTLEAAIDHPFLREYCTLIYTTPSHRPDWHRFRMVFRLPEFVADLDHYEAIVRFLLEQIPHDPACKDGVRVFYGNTAAEFPLINPQAVLPPDWVAQAAIQAQQDRIEQAQREELRSLKSEQFQQRAQAEGWDTDALIEQALSLIPPRTPGSGNYQECITVAMALHSHYGAAAEIIIERWSPSIKGDTWNVRQKIRSFKRSDITIGSLFHLAKQYGFRFPQHSVIEHHDSQEPDPRFVEDLQQQEAEQDRIEQAQAIERQREQQERYRKETGQIQAELAGLRIHPTIVASGRYIAPGLITLPEKPGIMIVDASMGSGKTSSVLKGLVEEHRSQTGSHSTELLFVPRNTLGRQSGQVLELPHRDEQSGHIDRGSLCFESIHLIDLGKVSARPLILLDEVSQSFQQILNGATCRNHHAFVINRLRRLLQMVQERDGVVVLSEDGITNLELDLIQEASGLEVVSHLKFDKTAHGRKLTLFNHPALTWQEICYRVLECQENLILASDSQAWARQISTHLLEQGIDPNQLFLFDSDSSTEAHTRYFAESPDAFIQEFQPRVIVHTPTISSGVSIQDPLRHFAGVGFHLTHLPARSAKQMLERLRSDVPRFGDAVVKARASEDDSQSCDRPDLLLKNVKRNQAGIAKLSAFAHYAMSRDAELGASVLDKMQQLDLDRDDSNTDYGFFLRHWSRYEARYNYEKKHIRADLIEVCERQGYQIERFKGKSPESQQQREDMKEKLADRDAIAFAQACTAAMSLDEARRVLASESSKPPERLIAHKRLLEDRIPGCDLDSVEFVRKVVVDDQGNFLKRSERYWIMRNPEAAKWLDRWNWLNHYVSATKRDEWVAPVKLSMRSAQAKLLSECPLIFFLDGTIKEWGDRTEEAIAVKQWALERKPQLYRYFRLSIREKQSPKAIVNKLLKLIGIEIEERRRIGGRGQQERLYAATNLEDHDRTQILESLSQRFERRLHEKEPSSQNLQLKNSIQVLSTPPENESVRDAISDHSPGVSFSEAKEGGDQPIPETLEQIEDIAGLMESCGTAEALSAIKGLSGMTRSLWQSAGKLLSQEKRPQIWEWAKQLLDSGQSPEPSVSR